MKRLLLTAVICALSLLTVSAQMSDAQVLNFIKQETKAGTSQSQILTKLVQRGVKVEQIRKLRKQYEQQQKGQSRGQYSSRGSSDNIGRSGDSRLRTNNGSGRGKDITTGKNRQNADTYPDDYTRRDRTRYDRQRYDRQDRDYPYRDSRSRDYTYRASQYGDYPYEYADSLDTDMPDYELERKDKLKIFGHDIFNQRALTFEPNMNIATPQNYVLGPGDEVVIDVYGASQKTLELTVSPEGTVTVPDYGPIQVGGLTVSAANSKIRSSLGSRYRSSEVKLTVGQTRTIMVNVMGEVKVPGTYTLSAFATVFHALYMAGGINDIGTLRNIKVYRQGRLITVVDIYEYILNGRLAGNVRLHENDVIQVGTYDCLVEVTGNVKRPMFYEMRNNESVGTLIKYAGGFTGDAYRKAVRLVRQTGEKRSVHTVDEFDMSTFKIDDGDLVTVDAILDRYENMVEVKGAVFRPGQYQLGKDINSVRTLVEHADGLTEDAFTARAILHRMKSDRTLEVIAVDLGGILAGTVADIPLANEDVLFIPTQADRISERTLTIGGEVMSPGVYEYADNTTIEDLVMQAGGLTDAASLVKVDVSRRIINPKATSSSKEISKNYTFSLKDGFVVDGQPGFKLEPYDVVQVRRSPGYMVPRTITVEGEVMYEGKYTMSNKNQRLSDAIKAAGGVTSEAYVRGTRLERLMNEDELARRDMLLRQLRQQSTQKDSVDMGKLVLDSIYTVGIHLDEALANPGSDADIQLRDGDRLVVPEYNGVVKISGNVMFPNTVAYTEGKNYKWYINQAGGFGNGARKRATWIIYQNGTMSKVGRGVKIEPGCEIIVPTKNRSNALGLAQWLTIGTSITSMAAMVATIANVLK